ncbi:MAG TPA: class I SAM-dependent methyltransferase [Rhizomicrobium sp.]|nr:class I SAM-dependent methyltransferase [Rhizomicrobium sp.]
MSQLAVTARCPELDRILTGQPAVGASGAANKPRSTVKPELAQTLYETLLSEAPVSVIEIGMAFGASSLAILAALAELNAPNSGLISVDPKQTERWDRSGALAVERAGYSKWHTLIEEADYEALPALLRQGKRFQFGYIDGWHTFDYTLLDFFYIDRMLDVGGIAAFNDCSWPAVDKVLRFVVSHRKYEEISVGLKRIPAGDTRWQRLRAGFEGRQAQDRYFRKTADWEPNWDFFSAF